MIAGTGSAAFLPVVELWPQGALVPQAVFRGEGEQRRGVGGLANQELSSGAFSNRRPSETPGAQLLYS